MGFNILKKSTYYAIREYDPQITLNLDGRINLNVSAATLIGSTDDIIPIHIINDDDGNYYFSLGDKNNSECWFFRKRKQCNIWKCNSLNIVNEIIANYDLPVSKDKKQSIRIDVLKNHILHDNLKLFMLKKPDDVISSKIINIIKTEKFTRLTN